MYLRSLVLFIPLGGLFCTVGHWPILSARLQGWIMCGLLGIPAAALLSLWRPLVAELVDYDERRTGYRREAIYFGMEALGTKLAEGIAALSIGLLLERLGFSVERYLGVIFTGPLAAILAVVAYLVFRRYPLGQPSASEE